MNDINKYIDNFIYSENPLLDRITEEYQYRKDITPCIGSQTARILSWLIKLNSSRRIIEFGTCIGYSTIVLAQAAKENKGSLTSIESAKNHYRETKINLKEAGLLKYVNLILGNAESEFKKLSGSFDFILQDSLKSLYPKMFSACIEKITAGGIIAAHDTLFKPLGKKQKFSSFMDRYNKLVFADSRLYSTILPIGDGLTICIKK
ncbi:MAG: O-methyltransferase [Victivallales bacterium]|nr:O-methyltransferase [Victivallales bacterium]